MKKDAFPISLLRLREVMTRTGLSRARVYQLQHQRLFPQSFRL
ncbi:MAG: AlpA family phage regulatory protein, partial [Gammaproteobacteria bacterium]